MVILETVVAAGKEMGGVIACLPYIVERMNRRHGLFESHQAVLTFGDSLLERVAIAQLIRA